MSFVDDDGVVLSELAIFLHGIQQDAVGHHFDFCFSARLIGEAHLIADQLTKLNLEFFGDAFGNRSCCDASWLGVGDAFAA